MSLGYVGHARLEAEDTEITIYSYTGENWNVRDEEMRKRLESTGTVKYLAHFPTAL